MNISSLLYTRKLVPGEYIEESPCLPLCKIMRESYLIITSNDCHKTNFTGPKVLQGHMGKVKVVGKQMLGTGIFGSHETFLV